MAAPLTDVERIRRLPWLVSGDALNIAFVSLTFAGPVFILFLDQLGLGNAQIGFLLSLIPFCGIVALFVAPLVTRLGYKRTFITFWGIRKFVMALLLLTPLFLARFGSQIAFLWVAGVLFWFAICRAIAETGRYPWQQEVIPDSIRGKISAISHMSTTVAAVIARGIRPSWSRISIMPPGHMTTTSMFWRATWSARMPRAITALVTA